MQQPILINATNRYYIGKIRICICLLGGEDIWLMFVYIKPPPFFYFYNYLVCFNKSPYPLITI